MRRDFGNEVVIAFLIVAVIIVALASAVLLSDTQDEADATATQVALDNATDTPTATDTATFTPTDTPTDIPPTATDTPTPITPTATDIPTLTDTSTPVTPTATDIPPTDTFTASPIPLGTETIDSTSATISPTANVATSTVTRSASPTEKPTNPLTEVDTLIPTPTTLATAAPTQPITESSMVFMGIIPTPPPTPTVAQRGDATRIPSTCRLPQGWREYRVASGNTLFAIALATNSTVDELRYINCIEDIDNITTGDVIFVPRLPTNPVSTVESASARQGLSRIGCGDSRIQITSPITIQRLSGTFTVYGTADREDFLYYKIEIRPDWATIYNFYLDSHTPVHNDVLGTINAELFDDGLYWILLTVVNQRAEIPAGATCEIPVIFG